MYSILENHGLSGGSGDADEGARLKESIIDCMDGMSLAKLRAVNAIVKELQVRNVEVVPAKMGDRIIEPHPDYETVIALKAATAYALEGVANNHGLFDLAQDNAIRTLEMALLHNTLVPPGRNGHDLSDCDGNEIELKTLNYLVTTGFSSHQRLNTERIDTFEKRAWLFGVYAGPEMMASYVVDPLALKPLFDAWRQKVADGSMKNNPKISLSLVVEYGSQTWGSPINLKGWKKMDKKSRKALPHISERDNVASLSPALALSRESFERRRPPVQMDLPLLEAGDTVFTQGAENYLRDGSAATDAAFDG